MTIAPTRVTHLSPLAHARRPAEVAAECDANTRLLMTLTHLKRLATLMPIAVVVAQELVRTAIVGRVSLPQRLILDAVVVVGIVVFSQYVFRFVDQMQEQLRRRNDELLALHAAGLDVTSELALDAVLAKVVERARSLVGARYGALSVVGADGRVASFVTSGISDQQRAQIGPPPVGHGLLGMVLREGERLRLADLSRHPRSVGFPPHHPPMRSLLAVPIATTGALKGNLYLTEKQGAAEFSLDDEETLARFAVQAAIAIDNATLHRQAADLAVAQERLMIAHEMHDGLAQMLGYVNTKAQAVDAYLRRGRHEEASAQLRELAGSAREAYTDVREGIVALRSLPEPDRPLGEVLADFLQRWKEQAKVSTELQIEGELRLPPSVELQVVRIVQEALTNVRKHSRATVARVHLRQAAGELIAAVADDGVGFDAAASQRGEFPRFGLATMRERAVSVGGTLEVVSAPGRGTTVRLRVPLAGGASPPS
jgi:nitrate/nitrite-specific signal transduction histidine kinase